MADEIKKDDVIDEVEEPEEVEETQPEDKPVASSQFNKYREAYIRERLRDMKVTGEAEQKAAIQFIDERSDVTDSNFDEIIDQLRIRLRVDERKGYIHQSSLGGGSGRPQARNNSGTYGKELYERIKNKGRL